MSCDNEKELILFYKHENIIDPSNYKFLTRYTNYLMMVELNYMNNIYNHGGKEGIFLVLGKDGLILSSIIFWRKLNR